ncbi:MAG TPA: hypothetical protein VGF79_00565 [Bacteroidia bacterium]
MEQQIINQIKDTLVSSLKNKFGLEDAVIDKMTAMGVNNLTSGLKQYVLKNGTTEIEDILTGKMELAGSGIRKSLTEGLGKELASGFTQEAGRSGEIAEFSIDNLVGGLKGAFLSSTHSKDIDGIADFIGVDKNLLKMANSPAAKFFGKFF